MIVDRYYYSQLNKQEQAIYKAFYNGAMSHQDIIPIPTKGKISDKVFNKVFLAMTRDNPLIYHLNQSACNYAVDALGHTAICPQYFFSKEKVKEYNRKIEKVVNSLAAQLKLTEGTDYEKEIKIHDWMCQNVKYDDKGADMSNPTRVVAAHNIIGVFAHHKAQCEGIAKATKVLLNAVDVKCIVVTGNADGNGQNGPHAWNIVNLDGKSYQLDVTWDIGAASAMHGAVPYDYFNISDELISKDHKADGILPECKSLDDNYFTSSKVSFRKKSRLLAYIEKGMKNGQREFYFRFEGKIKMQDIMQDISNVASRTMAELGAQQIRIQHVPNEKLGICWMKIY